MIRMICTLYIHDNTIEHTNIYCVRTRMEMGFACSEEEQELILNKHEEFLFPLKALEEDE